MKIHHFKIYILLHIVVFLLGMSSCTTEKFVGLDEQVRKDYHIAVVLPYSDGMEEQWRHSIDWALEGLNKSLIPQRGIRITAEWYNEDDYSIKDLFTSLAEKTDIYAIIGPLYSAHAAIASECCAKTGKPLLPALASSEQMMRAYAGKGFLWCLTENDISQCEVLLAKAIQKGAKTVSLITSDDLYGQTFSDWFAFEAKELGLSVYGMEVYADTDLEEKMRKLISGQPDCLICVSPNNGITKRMNDIRRSVSNDKPFFLFSDGAFLLPKDKNYEGMEGVVQTHDPSSGFQISYETRYGKSPSFGNAHFYDATLLAGLGILQADIDGNDDVNEAIKHIVSMDGDEINACTDEGMNRIVSSILRKERHHVTGASGKLHFDPTLYTNVLHSVYCHWTVYQGKHLILEYNTSDDSNRTDASVVNWNWRVTQMQDFIYSNTTEYAPKKDLYALIIAAAKGWTNYRHQADAYAVYQRLRENGLDKKHIILVADDDLAYNALNPTPGSVRLSDNGNNLYTDIPIYRHPSDISWKEYEKMIVDNEDGILPSDSTTNLLVYWVGHGTPNGLQWADQTVRADEIGSFFNTLAKERRFRKALLLFDTCYSGMVGAKCEDIPGLLCITAANAMETSKANRYSPFYNTWMSNSFSDALLDMLDKDRHQSLYEVYSTLYNHTIGSHVSVYNAERFDNLHKAGINEFLYPR